MVPWWKRVIYSLASVLIASIACGVLFESQHLLERDTRFQAADLFWFIFPVLVFSIPGWMLAMPIVLTQTNFIGSRLWTFFAIGSSIGPVVTFGLALYERLTSPHYGGFWGNWRFFALATGVSCMTTLIYLVLIRHAQGISTSG